MLERIHNQIGTAGLIVAIVALVVALGGGAMAATGTGPLASSSGKAKQGPRGPRGKTGPAGPQGPAGSQGVPGTPGAPGPKGTSGTNGTNGEDGKSVTLATFTAEDEEGGSPAGEPCQLNGGSEVEVEGSENPSYVCNGSPWTAGGTLPPGQTLKGDWTTEGTAGVSQDRFSSAVSFVLPLEEAPEAHYINVNHKENFTNFNETLDEWEYGEREIQACPGNAEEPEAAPGNLCVYASREEGIENEQPGLHKPLPAVCAPGTESELVSGEYQTGILCAANKRDADRFGFNILSFSPGSTGSLEAGGTWAVTASEP